MWRREHCGDGESSNTNLICWDTILGNKLGQDQLHGSWMFVNPHPSVVGNRNQKHMAL